MPSLPACANTLNPIQLLHRANAVTHALIIQMAQEVEFDVIRIQAHELICFCSIY